MHNFFKKQNCKLDFYDPVVNYWKYTKNFSIDKKQLRNYDVYVYLIKHNYFNNLKIKYKENSIIFDLNHVLKKDNKLKILKNKKYKSYFIGSKKI